MPWFCLKFNINSCGNEIPDMMYQHVQFIKTHDSTKSIFKIETDFDESNCDISFGLDDLQIYI